MQIAQQIKYINSYSFKYSPRPHTGAALMPDQIPENIKSARLAKLDTYLNEVQRDFNLSCIDKTLSCLLEGPDKTGKHLVYRTQYMQPCIVAHRDNAPEMANIVITTANKACLRGKFTD
jgi:tRNA-2-methylthio-N6-dimethylallyladenosine synthase